MSLFIKGYGHKSAIISGNFLGTVGLEACVHSLKADANKSQNLRMVPREPGSLLSCCDYCQAIVNPPQHLYCVQSCYCLLCGASKKSKPNNLTDVFHYGRMFLINAVVQGMWCLVRLWPQGGRTHELGPVPPENTCVSGQLCLCSRQKGKQQLPSHLNACLDRSPSSL